MTDDQIPLLIFGARSYTAGELLRLLAAHPVIKPAFLVSRSLTGGKESPDKANKAQNSASVAVLAVGDVQPHMAGFFDGCVVGPEEAAFQWLASTPNAAIALCTGSHESAPIVAELAKRGLLGNRVLVDLSGDFRLPSDTEYREWYGKPHACPEMLAKFDYCIPELHRSRCRSRLVSNPGCFATAVQLAVTAGMAGGLVLPRVDVFAVTGSSGSGATPKPNTHHPFRAHEFYAYKPLNHQHTPEIVLGVNRALEGFNRGPASKLASEEFSLVTHSAPLVRGISVTASFRLASPGVAEDWLGSIREFATNEPMLRWSEGPPGLAGVIGTNLARMGAAVDGSRGVVFCAIDNLTRGASGQALQNLNRVLGLAEVTGLQLPGMNPA
jgi:N-acetyl-gamma-glutamyl-phosphate reductase